MKSAHTFHLPRNLEEITIVDLVWAYYLDSNFKYYLR